MSAITVTTATRTMSRGVAFILRFQWLDAAEEPIPLNGDALVFAYRDAQATGQGFTTLYEITLDAAADADGSTFVTEDEDEGQYLVTLTNEHTAAVEIDSGVYWVRRQIDDDPEHDEKIFGGALKIRNP